VPFPVATAKASAFVSAVAIAPLNCLEIPFPSSRESAASLYAFAVSSVIVYSAFAASTNSAIFFLRSSTLAVVSFAIAPIRVFNVTVLV
jgi:hypothetical protein